MKRFFPQEFILEKKKPGQTFMWLSMSGKILGVRKNVFIELLEKKKKKNLAAITNHLIVMSVRILQKRHVDLGSVACSPKHFSALM